jgi:hypothetical protein
VLAVDVGQVTAAAASAVLAVDVAQVNSSSSSSRCCAGSGCGTGNSSSSRCCAGSGERQLTAAAAAAGAVLAVDVAQVSSGCRAMPHHACSARD